MRDCLPPCVSLVCPNGGLWGRPGRGGARVGLCLSVQSSSYVPLSACDHDLDPHATLPTFVLTCVVLYGLRMGRYLLRLRPETKEWIGHHLEQNLARSVRRCEKECRRRRADGPSLARVLEWGQFLVNHEYKVLPWLTMRTDSSVSVTTDSDLL